MAQEPPDKSSHFILGNREASNGVMVVAQGSIKETEIAGDQGRLGQLSQERDNLLVILHALTADVLSDLPTTNSPTSQKKELVLGNVLVQKNHGCAGSESD